MNARLPLTIALLLLLSSACAARRIPGTDFEDTSDTRAILQVMEAYRTALEARDAAGIIKLVSESFTDDAGTLSPADDLDYASLREKLPERLAKLEDVEVQISVRKLTVERDTASVIYYYNTRFRIPGLTTKPLNEGDLKQMWLKRVGGDWKIVSGL